MQIRMIASTVIAAMGVMAAGSGNCAAAPPSADRSSAEADLVLRNAQIYTPTGWAHAVAIKRGVI